MKLLVKTGRWMSRAVIVLAALKGPVVLAQAELEPWGNLTGIRVHGQLIPFITSLRVVSGDATLIISTAKEKQRPRYWREGNHQVVTTRIDSLYFREDVEDLGEGSARVRVTCYAAADQHLEGIYFSLQMIPDASGTDSLTYATSNGTRTLSSGTPTQVNIPLHEGDVALGDTLKATVDLRVGGHIDHSPVHLVLNSAQTGRPFEGIGGNFRIQNLKTDPEVIDYNLAHLRVAWGRVEMPWRLWQPALGDHPLDSAAAGRLNPVVTRALEMAGRLSKMGIPLILSAWFPPDWAIRGPYKARPGEDGVWGNPLDPARLPDVYKSIADYLTCLKDRYGAEVKLFSFNESDLGINVRMTGLEHDAFIKGLGAYLASRGLSTKLLLGDNSDATTYAFIQPALGDPDALPFIGAISFHSWRGFDTATLSHWADAATRLGLPLIVAEGSIDAAAWNYPAIFTEPAYALKEVSLYTRILAVCQPLSILQWQLTSDYSLLAGGGIWGDTGQLRPTQRFWNLRQLASTPPGLRYMPLSDDRPDVACAALGNLANGSGSPAKPTIVLHIVNNGATREALLEGLPAGVKALRVCTTSQTKSMEAGTPVKVVGGKAEVTLEAESFVTLITP
jgi:hypothetical protein